MSNDNFLFESKPEERAFNKQYSRFKVIFYFKNGKMKGKPVTYHAKEKYGISVLQIDHGHYKKVTLNRAAGLAHCLRLVEHYKGLYTTAIIFDKRKKTHKKDDVVETGLEVMKFVNDACVVVICFQNFNNLVLSHHDFMKVLLVKDCSYFVGLKNEYCSSFFNPTFFI